MISRRRLCTAALTAPIVASVPSFAMAADNDVNMKHASLYRDPNNTPPGLYLSVDWEFELSTMLLDSLRRGISLYFIYEFRLEKSRWYWLNKELSSAQLVHRLSYSPLSRQYRLSRGGLTQSFDSLESVVPLLLHVRDWHVADLMSFQSIDPYIAETRVRLDLSQLPKPLQVSIGGSSDWELDSDWVSVPLSADQLTS